MTSQSEYQGPKRGADRAVLLAHGAGADMHATALTTVADALAAAKVPSLRFNFPYMAAGRRGPDRPPVLAGGGAGCRGRTVGRRPRFRSTGSCWAAGRWAAASLQWSPPIPTIRFLRSGSCCSAIRCIRRASRRRCGPSTSRAFACPCLFVSGTRDAFGTPDELQRHAKEINGAVEWHWIETADHGFKPLKSSGLTVDAALAAAAAEVVRFVGSL